MPAKRKSAENDLLPFFLVEVFCFPISGGKCQGSQYMHVPSPYEQGERCALSLPFPISFFSQRGYFVIIVIGFPSVSARSLLLRAPLQILHFPPGARTSPPHRNPDRFLVRLFPGGPLLPPVLFGRDSRFARHRAEESLQNVSFIVGAECEREERYTKCSPSFFSLERFSHSL